jgi:xanthine dehydrogenase YagR molybdenum-binding subunit
MKRRTWDAYDPRQWTWKVTDEELEARRAEADEEGSAEKEYYLEGYPILETPPAETDPEPWGETRVVGTRRPRVDAYERVSGTARYPSDLVMPGMLYAAILRCPHPHARVLGVDVSAAESMDGVEGVISAFTPVPAAIRGHEALIREQLFPQVCRYEGEAVAAVVARTPYLVHDALRAIDVQYEELPFVSDERDAWEAGAPLVHEDGNMVSEPRTYERGDLEAGFAAADVVLEENYRTEAEFHTPLEPHGLVAAWDGDALTLWESTQGVFSVQAQAAAALQMPMSKVRVVGHYMGGGFGAKLSAGKYTLVAALLSRVSARPVKLFLSREETLLVVGNRPPNNMRLKAGIMRDGTLTALEFEGTGTGGAYPAGGTSALEFLIQDLYTCENVRTETRDYFINSGPSRAMRAPGHPQCAWALEQMLDSLAEAIGMDPVEMRLKNIPTESQLRGVPYTTTGLTECMTEGAAAFGWEAGREETGADKPLPGNKRRGVGMGSCMWAAGGGGPPSTAIVKVFRDGSVNLNMGASDIGTGTKTVMAMVVAEELWVDPDDVQIEHADTGTTQFATGSGGSKTVPTESPAVRAAALDARRQLLDLAAAQLEVPAESLDLREGRVVHRDGSGEDLPLTQIRQLRRQGVVVGIGYRGPNPSGMAVNPFAAQFCEVEVDMDTGEVEILRFVGAHDSGRVMNRTTYDNQVFGGIAMGIGFGTTEKRILDRGRTGLLLNRSWHDYKVPTAMDVPADIEVVPIEPEDQQANSTGAKGIGEPATIATAPAVANAVYHATGVRITATPITPAALVEAMANRRGRV